MTDDELERRIAKLENAHSQHLKNHEYTPAWVQVYRMASISFLAVFILAIVSIKVRYETFSFEVPVESLTNAMAVPAIASLLAGGATYLTRPKQ